MTIGGAAVTLLTEWRGRGISMEAEEEEDEEQPRTAAITAAIYTIRSKEKSTEWVRRRRSALEPAASAEVFCSTTHDAKA